MKKRDRRKRQTITAQAASKLSSTETSKELVRPLRLSVLLFGLVLAVTFGSYAYGVYDPGLGRFCSRDPIGYAGSEWGLNDFGDSNPFNSLDPTGLIIVMTGPHGGGLYGGCETLTKVKTEVLCKYFKLGWWSLWEKEIRFPYTPGIDATKLRRSNTPSKWVFERVGYERTTTTTTWCRSCSPVAVGLCKPSFKVGPVECVITATVVVGKIYLDNQPEVDEKKEPWDPPSEPDIDNGGDCYCMCKVNGSSNEPMGRMSRAECKKLPFAKSGVESCYCKGDK